MWCTTDSVFRVCSWIENNYIAPLKKVKEMIESAQRGPAPAVATRTYERRVAYQPEETWMQQKSCGLKNKW